MRPIGPNHTIHGRAIRLAALMILALGGFSAHPTFGVPDSLSEAVPQDVVAAWFVQARQPDSPGGSLNSLNVARFMIDQAAELGLLARVDPVSRGWIDTLASLSTALDYPHAVALFQVKARGLESGGHRLAALHGALILETRGENRAVEQRIQRLLNTYANDEESVLSTTKRGEQAVFSLRDRRLPDWVVLSWGQVGDYYVVAIGEHSLERVVETIEGKTPCLSRNPWFQSAFKTVEGAAAWLAIWADFRLLRTTADVGLSDKVARVRDILGLDEVDRGLWTIRYDGRAVRAVGLVAQGGRDVLRPLTTGEIAGQKADRLIPEDATGYAIFDSTPKQALGLFAEAYLASRSPDSRQDTVLYWRALQRKSGVSIDNDILARLGPGVVIHDHPRHPLSLPLLWTIAVPIKGNPTELQGAIDRLLKAWQDELKQVSTNVSLRRRPDGIWHLFIGINGPAIGLSDRWLVMSFAPEAVRENLALLGAQDPNVLAGPTAEPEPQP